MIAQLLTVSEALTQVGDWIVVNLDKIGITLSIPVVVGLLAKLLTMFIKNKITIKQSTLTATKQVKSEVLVMKDIINNLCEDTKKSLLELEKNISVQIDNKFIDLQDKRKKIYNDTLNGVDSIQYIVDTKTEQVVNSVEEVEEKVEETIEEVEQVIEEVQQTENKTISVDEIMR